MRQRWRTKETQGDGGERMGERLRTVVQRRIYGRASSRRWALNPDLWSNSRPRICVVPSGDMGRRILRWRQRMSVDKEEACQWLGFCEQLPFFSQNWLRAFEDMKERKVLTSWDGRFVVHYGRKWRGRWRKWWEKRENERGWERKKWKMKKVGGADVFWGAKVRF